MAGMWSNNKSKQVVVPQLIRFKPPYCPNPDCPWHHPDKAKGEARFHRHGSLKIARHPFVSPRFRCTKCTKAFASSYFRLHYRDRTPPTYEQIFDLRRMGASKREVARFLNCSLDSVLRRQRKMARWALLTWSKDVEKISINESIAFDGLENFSFSQYEPNNINHAVGRDSFFIYDFNLSPMNRKGRMSPRQKTRKLELEEGHGRFPRAITRDARAIFERLLAKTDQLTLHTDNHYAYRRALEKINSPKVFHLITPAKVARNYKNRLFAINHTDMLTRHHLTDFKRETIAFAKHTVSMQESFVLLSVFKNYMRPCFIKPHKKKYLNKESPAMRLGLRKKILSFCEFFRTRPAKGHAKLNPDWQNLFARLDPVSRHPILAYQGI